MTDDGVQLRQFHLDLEGLVVIQTDECEKHNSALHKTKSHFSRHDDSMESMQTHSEAMHSADLVWLAELAGF